jgi:hypothetical protein
MMGFEPTTFCMASASVVRMRSRPCAQTAWLQRVRPRERTQPHPSERSTLPFLPREETNDQSWAVIRSAAAAAAL